MNKLFIVSLLAAVSGCAAGQAAPAQSPQAASPASEPAAPAAQTSAKPEPAAAAPVPAKVPDPPSSCAEYVSRAAANCGKGDAREALALALSESAPGARDQKLVCLEADAGFAAGFVRALRADLAPEVCADVIVSPVLEANKKIDSDLEQTLTGLLIAGKLGRLAADPPILKPPFDKQQFLDYFKKELRPWVLSQAAAIGELSQQGARLNGYGKAVVAVAAGTADLRFVDLVRAIPLPEEMKNDREVRDVYYATLDEALEPRKQRGRDAALVGLRLFSQLGSLRDDRIDRARALLSKLYSGARVDALDQLLLPPLSAPKLDKTERKLAARLPSYYALALFADLDPSDKDTLRALLERGLSPLLRKKLDQAKLSPESSKLYARALVESGRRYFRAADFRRATELIGPKPSDDEARLLLGVSHALEAGPADIAELMLKGPPPSGMGDLRELEGLAKSKSKLAGMAGFDAAYILELVPRRDDASFWEGLAARYDAAAKLLDERAQKQRASEYANAAKATARALGSKQ